MRAPAKIFRRPTTRMKRENMLEKPLVSRPPEVRKAISKPKLLPRMTRKSVAEVEIVKPRIVEHV
jgi:hypothetical protein